MKYLLAVIALMPGVAYAQDSTSLNANDITPIIAEVAKYGTLPIIGLVVIIFLLRENRILRKQLK